MNHNIFLMIVLLSFFHAISLIINNKLSSKNINFLSPFLMSIMSVMIFILIISLNININYKILIILLIYMIGYVTYFFLNKVFLKIRKNNES